MLRKSILQYLALLGAVVAFDTSVYGSLVDDDGDKGASLTGNASVSSQHTSATQSSSSVVVDNEGASGSQSEESSGANPKAAALTFGGQDEFLKEERALIAEKELTLYGIALFSGDDVISAFIRAATHSAHSHCGVVLKDQHDELYCFESTGSAPDILGMGVLPQVQIHRWEETVSGYGGGVVLRQILFDAGSEPDAKQMTTMVSTLLGTYYEKDMTVLIKAIAGGNTKDEPQSIFCSELVARVLIELGYLSSHEVADNYLPRDFSAESKLALVNAHFADELTQKKKKAKCCTIL